MKIFYCILLFPFLVVSQTISGTFLYKSKNGVESSSLTFNDSLVIKSQGHAFAHGSILSKGTYQVIRDTVYVNYIPWTEHISKFDITSRIDSSTPPPGSGQKRKKLREDILSLRIKVFDQKNNPLKGPPIHFTLRSKKGLVAGITQFDSNELNYYHGDNTIEAILVLVMGYRPVRIPFEDLYGSYSEIKVNLAFDDNNTYNQDSFEQRYYRNKADGTLKLISADSVKPMIYNLIDPETDACTIFKGMLESDQRYRGGKVSGGSMSGEYQRVLDSLLRSKTGTTNLSALSEREQDSIKRRAFSIFQGSIQPRYDLVNNDSIRELQLKIDRNNTFELLQIVREDGWPDPDDFLCAKEVTRLHKIFANAPEEYWDDIRKLLDKEKASNRIPEADYNGILNHLKRRSSGTRD